MSGKGLIRILRSKIFRTYHFPHVRKGEGLGVYVDQFFAVRSENLSISNRFTHGLLMVTHSHTLRRFQVL